MRATVVISKSITSEKPDDDRVIVARIEGKKFDDVLREARHLGYLSNAVQVEVWREDRRADRRAWVSYRRSVYAGTSEPVMRGKLGESARLNHVYLKDMPKVEWKVGGDR